MAVAQLLVSDKDSDQFVYTNNTGSSLTAGTPYRIRAAAGSECIVIIPLNDIANGSSGVVYKGGKWRIDADSSTALASGLTLWYDNSASEATSGANATAAADFVIGYTAEAKAAAGTYADFFLNEGASAYTSRS